MRCVLAVAVTVAALGACGPGAGSGEEDGSMPSPSASASESSPMSTAPVSPSELPTIAQPTAPPSAPTDVLPRGTVAGRVTALTDGCTDIKTDNGVVWSLVGEPDVTLEVGATVTARVTDVDEGDASCGAGLPVRLVSIRVAGQ